MFKKKKLLIKLMLVYLYMLITILQQFLVSPHSSDDSDQEMVWNIECGTADLLETENAILTGYWPTILQLTPCFKVNFNNVLMNIYSKKLISKFAITEAMIDPLTPSNILPTTQ